MEKRSGISQKKDRLFSRFANANTNEHETKNRGFQYALMIIIVVYEYTRYIYNRECKIITEYHHYYCCYCYYVSVGKVLNFIQNGKEKTFNIKLKFEA